MSDTVFLTDYAWPDDSVERDIVESAGMRLVSGPAAPLPASGIQAMVREHRPCAILTCWAPVSAEAVPLVKVGAALRSQSRLL